MGDESTLNAYIYAYYQNGNLSGRSLKVIPAGTSSWHDNIGSTPKYYETLAYDLNGNIISHIRAGNLPADSYKMDELLYDYTYNSNKLDRVRENYLNPGAYTNDIEGQSAGNYNYDKIGNLISDVQEGITGIFWNVYGKIREIRKGSTVIKYRYDAAGNRVYKEEVGPGVNTATWYVRDAQGNTLATYEGVATPTIKESYIYGSSRLGSYSWNIGVGTPARTYEISNYLGNVMATIGDGQIPRMNGSLIEYYDADIKTATDYYSYGMVMPGRSFNSGTYRYGFNGKENDNEISGSGNQYDYGFRIYNPRLGRFLSVDPLTKGYPWYTPYQFAGNNPIEAIDLDGLEPESSKKEGFLKGLGKSLLKGGKELGVYIFNNPNHAGFGYSPNMKSPKVADFERYEINWSQLFDPTWQAQNWSENLVYGTINFVGGIIDGDGERTGNALPQVLSTLGTLSIFKGKISLTNTTKSGGIAKVDISFGKNINLERFAKRTSTSSFHTWDNSIPGYSSVKQGFDNFEDAFNYVTDAAINTNGKIKFNLEYVNLQQVGRIKPGTGLYQPLEEFGNKSLWQMEMTTEWELSRILNDPQLSKISEFQRMGVSVPENTVRELTKPKK